MEPSFIGLGMHLGNLPLLSRAHSRSISAENPTGSAGLGGKALTGTGALQARDLGQGWKISPCITLPPRAKVTLADIDGPGAIQHLWMTVDPQAWRQLVLRLVWDGEDNPSVEVPLGDFFCNGWCVPCRINSVPIAVNPAGGFNSYWEMPFRKHAILSVENLSPAEIPGFFYQVDYTLTEIPCDRGYFHAQWRRANPLAVKQVHTILDGASGLGHYVGTYLAWRTFSAGWWGEGEVKFYLDGDGDFPTICGTGTEDYFGGAWGFAEDEGAYGVFSTPFLGFPQAIKLDRPQEGTGRFSLYRWHIMDPVRFQHDLRVTIQALGWDPSEAEGGPRYVPLQDDIASTAFWYQTEPHVCFPSLPEASRLLAG